MIHAAWRRHVYRDEKLASFAMCRHLIRKRADQSRRYRERIRQKNVNLINILEYSPEQCIAGCTSTWLLRVEGRGSIKIKDLSNYCPFKVIRHGCRYM